MSGLIVKGVFAVDELKALGLPMAQRYADAKNVWLIQGRLVRQVKGPQDPEAHPIEYVDAFPIHGVVADCMMRIKAEYEARHPETPELAHSFVGQWLFYFIAPPDMVVIDAIAAGDAEKVKQSAEIFIRSDFGREPLDTISADGSSAPDQSPEGVLGAIGSGHDVRADR